MVGIVLGEINWITIAIVAVIEIVLIVALWYVYTEWSDLEKNYPELQVHQAAKRGSHPPIIEIMDLSGASRQFSGVKEKAQDVSFKNKDYRVIFDPRLAGTIPKDRYSDNVPVYRYVSSLYFPVDTIGAVAVSQEIGAERTFLTHLTHEISHSDEASLPEGVFLAYDGLALEL